MKHFATLALVGALAACETSPNGPRELLEIVTARERWERQGLRNYDFEFSAGCPMCDPHPKHIEVRDGMVLRSISLVSGDTTLAADWVPTVDSLYEWVLRDRAAERCGKQKVAIDAARHFPRMMTCAGVPEIADSGHWWTVSAFEVR